MAATTLNRFEKTREMGLRVQTFRYGSPVKYPEHIHSETSIVICTRGKLESSQFGVRTVLRPGEILFTNRNTPHASRYCFDGEACEGVTIDLDTVTAEKLKVIDSGLDLLDLNRTRLFGVIGSESIHRLAMDVRREIAANQPGKQLMLEAMAIQICVEVLRNWPAPLVKRGDGFERGMVQVLPRWQFIRAIEYMYRHAAPKVEWEQLAQQMDCDAEELACQFSETTGSDPQSCFEQILMQRARWMMELGRQSRSEVAEELGFRNVAQFRRTLRRMGTI